MMKNVVDEGTGTPAQLGGISVAGKTGTAQVGTIGSNLTQPWFIGFAPVENPKVAVAVTIERTPGRIRRHGRRPDRKAGDPDPALRGPVGPWPISLPERSSTSRYKVLSRLGAGGMADVFLAEDQQLGRKVALKLLHRRFAERPRLRRALPPRGPGGGRPTAPERRQRVRPRRV